MEVYVDINLTHEYTTPCVPPQPGIEAIQLNQATGTSYPILDTVETSECTVEGSAHFWVIDAPNGPTSHGTCKECGITQEFRNSIESSTWNKSAVKQEEDLRLLRNR